jgi:hypothetical protein
MSQAQILQVLKKTPTKWYSARELRKCINKRVHIALVGLRNSEMVFFKSINRKGKLILYVMSGKKSLEICDNSE